MSGDVPEWPDLEEDEGFPFSMMCEHGSGFKIIVSGYLGTTLQIWDYLFKCPHGCSVGNHRGIEVPLTIGYNG